MIKIKKFAVLALFGVLFSQVLLAKETYAEFQYYSGKASSFTLNPVLAVLKYSAQFSGSTSMKTLVFEIGKDGGTKRKTTIPVAANGTFNITYLYKGGPASYTLVVYGSPEAGALSYGGIGYINAIKVTASVPANLPGLNLNAKVLAFANSHMGKTVASGECWGTAAVALDSNGADWQRVMNFGKLLNPKKDKILAGDIIQFRSVKITEKNGAWTTLGAPDHTAIIHDVLGVLHYKVAHQNFAGKRFVTITELNLANMTAGEIWMYDLVLRYFCTDIAVASRDLFDVSKTYWRERDVWAGDARTAPFAAVLYGSIAFRG